MEATATSTARYNRSFSVALPPLRRSICMNVEIAPGCYGCSSGGPAPEQNRWILRPVSRKSHRRASRRESIGGG